MIMSTVSTGTEAALSGPPVPPLVVGRFGIHEAPAKSLDCVRLWKAIPILSASVSNIM